MTMTSVIEDERAKIEMLAMGLPIVVSAANRVVVMDQTPSSSWRMASARGSSSRLAQRT